MDVTTAAAHMLHMVSPARRQMHGAVGGFSHNAAGQQLGQGAVHRRVRLPHEQRQLRRFNERQPAQASSNWRSDKAMLPSVAMSGRCGQPARGRGRAPHNVAAQYVWKRMD
ncbi:MAG: hypothetical protein OXK79_12745 [Chloroflexota bacterium]|nr:hypothetical protein [Chloroflexota bacterium]